MVYSVYVFLDSRNRPYYVGKTNNMSRRRREHKEEILRCNPLPKYNKARKLINQGTVFKMRVIRKTRTEKEAYKLERYYIKKYRRVGYVLMNCTHGGPREVPMQINRPKKLRQTGITLPLPKVKLKKEKEKKITWRTTSKKRKRR